MATVLITGGTGLIGTALTKALLDKDYDVIILTRNAEKFSVSTSRLLYAEWNIDEQTIDREAITKADHVIHLSGTNVAEKRWTKKRKKEILESRTLSSKLLIKSINENANKIKTVISASAIGWYGHDRQTPNLKRFTETDFAYDDFLGQTCKLWEESIEPVNLLGKRLVKLRTGIVLSSEGGVLKEIKKLLKFGVATIFGNGRQIMSWIHIDDLVRLYIYVIENETMNGCYNAVAPNPVTNKKFILQLARTERGKFFIPVYIPAFVLKIAVGEMSIEVLKSATVSCDKLQANNFIFQYSFLTGALKNLSLAVKRKPN